MRLRIADTASSTDFSVCVYASLTLVALESAYLPTRIPVLISAYPDTCARTDEGVYYYQRNRIGSAGAQRLASVLRECAGTNPYLPSHPLRQLWYGSALVLKYSDTHVRRDILRY